MVTRGERRREGAGETAKPIQNKRDGNRWNNRIEQKQRKFQAEDREKAGERVKAGDRNSQVETTRDGVDWKTEGRQALCEEGRIESLGKAEQNTGYPEFPVPHVPFPQIPALKQD